MMEKDGLLPVPIFINGVEGHTVVRDLLTSSFEQRRRAEGIFDVDTLSPDCAEVRVVLTSPRFWAGREISRVGKKKKRSRPLLKSDAEHEIELFL